MICRKPIQELAELLRQLHAQRHSLLNQINTGNVKDLVPVGFITCPARAASKACLSWSMASVRLGSRTKCTRSTAVAAG